MARKRVDDFVLNKCIGGGSYGEVWRGCKDERSLGTSRTVAVRCVRRKLEPNVARLRKEVRLLRGVCHMNVLRFHGLKKSPSHFYLALEYCSGGDLAQLLRARGPLPEADSWRFCVQITAGLLALHCKSFVHGNLQPRSVLLSDSSRDPKVKLANFSSKPQPNPYTAPEVLCGQPCDGQADMWSAGAILYEMLFGNPPVCGSSRSQLLASHFSSEVNFAECRSVTGEGQALCRSLLGPRCGERPSSYQALCAVMGLSTRREAASSRLSTRPSCAPLAYSEVIPSLCKIHLAHMWPLNSARLACSKLAQRFLTLMSTREFEGLHQATTSAHEGDADLDSETESKVTYNHRYGQSIGPGSLGNSLFSSGLARDPVTYFVVAQLQYSHFFRLRTARLFPRVLYAM